MLHRNKDGRVRTGPRAAAMTADHVYDGLHGAGRKIADFKQSLHDTKQHLQQETHLKTITEEQTVRQKGEVQIAQLAYQLDLAQANSSANACRAFRIPIFSQRSLLTQMSAGKDQDPQR